MAANFSPAILETIRNRELLAQALEEQQQSIVRRRMFFRLFFLGTLASIAGYIVFKPELPDTKAMQAAAKLKAKISAGVAQQLNLGEKVMIAGENKKKEDLVSAKEYSQNSSFGEADGTDDMIAALEKRNAELKDFSDKHKSNLSKEQLEKIVEKSQNGSSKTVSVNSDPANGYEESLSERKEEKSVLREESAEKVAEQKSSEPVAPAAPQEGVSQIAENPSGERGPASSDPLPNQVNHANQEAEKFSSLNSSEVESLFPELKASPKTDSNYRGATLEELSLVAGLSALDTSIPQPNGYTEVATLPTHLLQHP